MSYAVHPSHNLGPYQMPMRKLDGVEHLTRACEHCGAEALSRLGLGYTGPDLKRLRAPCPHRPNQATSHGRGHNEGEGK